MNSKIGEKRSWLGRKALIATGLSITAALGLIVPGTTVAADYPTRQVLLINPFSAGGSLDIVGRLLAQKLQEMWGQPVIVENRPGGSTSIGINTVAKAKPDGYTLGLATNTFAMNATRFENLPYDSRKDIAPVSILTETPFFLVARSDAPAKTFEEFLEWAKKTPEGLNYGSIGVATSPHIGGEMLRMATGLDFTHVPYQGTPPALQGLIGGSTAVMFANVPDVVPHLKSKTLIAYAITEPRRSPSFPDVPTTEELGYPQINLVSWYAMIAPGGTPKEIIDKVSADVAKVLAMPDVRERLGQLELRPTGSSPEELQTLLSSEFDRYEKIVNDIGLEKVK